VKVKRFSGLSAVWLLAILLGFFSPVSSARAERVITQTTLTLHVKESTKQSCCFYFQSYRPSLHSVSKVTLAVSLHHAKILSLQFKKMQMVRADIKVKRLADLLSSILSEEEVPFSHC
jgi:hypothetical protein